jgi:hypothetical protein
MRWHFSRRNDRYRSAKYFALDILYLASTRSGVEGKEGPVRTLLWLRRRDCKGIDVTIQNTLRYTEIRKIQRQQPGASDGPPCAGSDCLPLPRRSPIHIAPNTTKFGVVKGRVFRSDSSGDSSYQNTRDAARSIHTPRFLGVDQLMSMLAVDSTRRHCRRIYQKEMERQVKDNKGRNSMTTVIRSTVKPA